MSKHFKNVHLILVFKYSVVFALGVGIGPLYITAFFFFFFLFIIIIFYFYFFSLSFVHVTCNFNFGFGNSFNIVFVLCLWMGWVGGRHGWDGFHFLPFGYGVETFCCLNIFGHQILTLWKVYAWCMGFKSLFSLFLSLSLYRLFWECDGVWWLYFVCLISPHQTQVQVNKNIKKKKKT